MVSLAEKRILSNKGVIAAILVVVCLVPFVGKAFHIDDPLFLWSAKQIQAKPLDFYGFDVNWYGKDMPMSQVTKNPPLASYFIAAVGSVFGYGEVGLHIAFMVVAAAGGVGVYYLAKEFCSEALLAALAGVLTPCFLVSATSVMCDVMMLAFWVWAVLLWVRGIKEDKKLLLLAGGVLIAVCALTKYFGMALLPLLLIYSVIKKRKVGLWFLFLVIPVVILAGYQFLTYKLYGRGLLLDAASYATKRSWVMDMQLVTKGFVSLAFMGGCVLTALFFVPLLWSRRCIFAGALITIFVVGGLIALEKSGVYSVKDNKDLSLWYLVQFGVMVVAGVSVLAVAAADFWRSRDCDSALLLFWVAGTFLFAGFVNWSVNARSILPMAPAVGILMVRRIERGAGILKKSKLRWGKWLLIPAAIAAMIVCWADYSLAGTARTAAKTIDRQFKGYRGEVMYQGHWGFQYYMDAKGYKAFDFAAPPPGKKDIIVIPGNNTNLIKLPEAKVALVDVLEFAPFGWVATMNLSGGAGFYSDIWGGLAFVIDKADKEKYYIYTVK